MVFIGNSSSVRLESGERNRPHELAVVGQQNVEERVYLQLIDDEDNRYPHPAANEEPHYHEIADPEVPESQRFDVRSAEQMFNTIQDRAYENITTMPYQSLEAATREVPTERSQTYDRLRSNETAIVEHI